MPEKIDKAQQIKDLALMNRQLEDQIRAIATAVRQMRTNLNDRAILLLLSDQSGVGIGACNEILNALSRFDKHWLKS